MRVAPVVQEGMAVSVSESSGLIEFTQDQPYIMEQRDDKERIPFQALQVCACSFTLPPPRHPSSRLALPLTCPALCATSGNSCVSHHSFGQKQICWLLPKLQLFNLVTSSKGSAHHLQLLLGSSLCCNVRP